MTAMVPKRFREFDVVIVGGGLVGATLACLLQPKGLRVALLERRVFDGAAIPFRQTLADGDHPCFDSRVSAISRASQELFKELGVWEAVAAKRCCAYKAMDVWDADGTGAVHFSATEINEPELGHIVENSLILDALYARLAGGPVELLSPCTVSDFRASEQTHIETGAAGTETDSKTAGERGTDATATASRVTIATEEGVSLAARLVVAADGGQSFVRHLAGFSTRQWDYGHEALVATVRTQHPHRGIARQRFMDSGPLAFLPLTIGAPGSEPDSESPPISSDDHYCSIVWSMLPAMAGEVMALPEASFRQRLAAAIEHRLGEVEWASRRFCFPLRQCHAVDYVRPGIALVGDAAHSIHPLAGQGVNLGLLDVKALAEELQRAVVVGRSPGDITVLRRYQRRRRVHNLGMIGLMEALKHLFAIQAPPVRWLRNTGMHGLDRLPPLKHRLARYAMGLENPFFL